MLDKVSPQGAYETPPPLAIVRSAPHRRFLTCPSKREDYHVPVRRLPHRRRRGFEALAELSPEKLGLSAERSNQLLLHGAWDAVVGDSLARHARPVALTRGVLEVKVLDDRWVEPLLSLLPRIAGRLNAHGKRLSIRKLRIRSATGFVDRLPASSESTESSSGTVISPQKVERTTPTIEQVRDRYLERQRSQ